MRRTEQRAQIEAAADHGLDLMVWSVAMDHGDEIEVLSGTSGGATRVAESRFPGSRVTRLVPGLVLGTMRRGRVALDSYECSLVDFAEVHASVPEVIGQVLAASVGARLVLGGGAAAEFSVEVIS